VFSLLDKLFGSPMADIVAPLRLPQHVLDALVRRRGMLGQRLRLAEAPPTEATLRKAGIDSSRWWLSQLHAYHWAIQVARNV
jgi:EAL and modified HD-GYP domain-containing signal transduction protein